MKGKLTLITPPDIFENDNISILFINLTEENQDAVSKWLATSNITDNINLYVFNGESNVSWFLYALSRCEYKYIELDNIDLVAHSMSGYVLGKSNVFYQTKNENLSAIYSHINQNRILHIDNFLETIFGDKTT